MPILGIVASSILKATGPSYESISTVTVGAGGSSASASFTSIPATYKHLQVRVFGRGTGTGNREYIAIRFNNDTGSNYWWHGLNGNGAGIDSQNSSTADTLAKAGFSTIPVSDAPANYFGSAVIDILDYASTSKYKTTRSIAGQDQSDGNGRLNLVSGVWNNTVAVNRVDVFLGSGSWGPYSSVALYGIK
jgi:hypothetical protein